MNKRFKNTVIKELERTKGQNPGMLTEADIAHLPEIVKKYIRYTGFVNRERVISFRSEFKGGIRSAPDEEYMPLKSVQYNFLDRYSRSFYIVAKKKGIPAIGLHLYQNAKAIFQVRVLGLFKIVDAKGPELDQAETVTVLNDIFFMSPGSLTDERIKWEVLDNITVRAVFTNDNIDVSAVVYFDNAGRLINFISNDRFDTDGKEYITYPWETPMTEYKNFNGYRLPSKAKVIYKRPAGDFCYGEFELQNIEYNCKEVK